MADRFSINFAKTFNGAMLLSVEPKMQRADRTNSKSEQVQALDKEGVPKWTVILAVQTKSFEQTKFENIQITVTSPNKPYGAIPLGSMVTVEGLELGIMAQSKGGFSCFYSAEAIRPLQPARMPAGQS
jgi:catalase